MKQYKHYIIYKITNLVNGKIYIGKHKCDNLDDSYFGSGKRLWLAINKYGIENFVFHVEIDLHNSEELDLLEQCVVNKEFLKRADVYNISRGGKTPCMYGKDNPFYGRTHSYETRQKISRKNKERRLSDIHKEHISRGLLKLLNDHPEIRVKFASKRNKKQCKNKITGEIKFFTYDSIPDDFEIYRKPVPDNHVPEEQKRKNRLIDNVRKHKSKWYTNGINECFCLPEKAPAGFVLGRLPTTNVGRTHSQETLHKMRLAKIGNIPSNKGKVWITNGTKNQYVSKEQSLPNGWKYGMTRFKGTIK